LVRACCRAVRIAPFSNRLAQSVPSKIQGLRCFANFGALRFSEPIRTLAESMVGRMVKHSSQSGGKYVSVHLRFEEVLLNIFVLVRLDLLDTLFMQNGYAKLKIINVKFVFDNIGILCFCRY